MVDVEKVLFGQSCKVISSEFDRSHRSWKYRIEGPDLEGELLNIVFCIDVEKSELILITAF